jgi:P-type Ca2+ transporter type 2C
MAASLIDLARADVGLSDHDAARRLRVHGPNELPGSKPKGLIRLAAEVLREPMLLLLVATAIIYLFLGDLGEALALVAAVLLVVAITLYQEQKTERTLQALRDLSSPRALVIRGGRTLRIAGREVVPGDVVVLSEGDRIPADAVVLSAASLRVDESLLTGESVPVAKHAADANRLEPQPPGHEVYSGTLVVGGEGIGRVTATGTRTHLGQIGTALADLDANRTAVQTEVSHVVRILAALGMSACVVVAVLYSVAQQHWIDGALAGLTMAIAMVPEEFPVILTIFLALGAWRISASRVLTRRLPAIEALGSTTVLCVDKTGTLTQNRMAIAAVVSDGERHDVAAGAGPMPAHVCRVIESGILASKQRPYDPMERAFFDFANHKTSRRSMQDGRSSASTRCPTRCLP